MRAGATSWCTFACAARWTTTSVSGYGTPPIPSGKAGYWPDEVLEQVAEVVRPGVHALVDAEDLVAVGEEPERQIGADLPGRAGEQDLHAATAVRCAPRSVVEVAPSIRTSTSSPGRGARPRS